MDAKLETLMRENPPLRLRFECKICKIEFTRTLIYDTNREEYLKFKGLEQKIIKIAEDDEELETLVFIDVCFECKNKQR
jgi:hypothetical protein